MNSLQMLRASMEIYEQYGTLVFATLGEKALAVWATRYQITPFEFRLPSTAGAGTLFWRAWRSAGQASAAGRKGAPGFAAAAAVFMTRLGSLPPFCRGALLPGTILPYTRMVSL